MKKGFTLIELLAVIIILGILMLIAIPSVTSYINNSRKETYVDSIKELIKGSSVLVNSGDINVNDPSVTYYIPTSVIKTENGEVRSPYGKITDAYVVVTYDGDDYDYYYVGKDESNIGIESITKNDAIKKDSIVEVDNVDTGTAIRGTEYVIVFDDELNPGEKIATTNIVSDDGSKIICKRATELHTAQCTRTDYYGCSAVGLSGRTITYGNLGTSGVLEAGDAFDCKVKKSGGYTERFYYVSDFYDTFSNSFDDSKAVLIYNQNTMGSIIPTESTVCYQNDGKNYIGLSSNARTYIPSVSVWDNLDKVEERTIRNELDGLTSYNGRNTITNPYNYVDRAARYLTYQEAYKACGQTNKLHENCGFFLENSRFEKDTGSLGFYLETVEASSSSGVWSIGQYNNRFQTYSASNGEGVRPAITLDLSQIDY